MRWYFSILVGITSLAVVLSPSMPQLQELRGPQTMTATSAEALSADIGVVEQMQRTGTLRVVEVVADPLVPGQTHRRFAQFHRNVRVLGGAVCVQTTYGQGRSVFGRVHPDIEIAVEPTLSKQDVIDRVGQDDGARVLAPPALAVRYDRLTGTYRLVYRVETFGPDGLVVREVDAISGVTIAIRRVLHTQGLPSLCADCAVGEGRGVKGDRKKLSVRSDDATFRADDGLRPAQVSTYDMRGDWSRVLDVLTGLDDLTTADLATDTDNVWEDGATVDAHTGTGWTLDYLALRFGRAGLDGAGSPIVVLVHPVSRTDLFTVPSEVANLFHLNAFFCGSCGSSGVVVFGEGLPDGQTLGSTGQTLDYFAAGLDIVAHELGHAVTNSTSRLIYEGESGALSEAFSDLLGVWTEFFMVESGRHLPERADYLVGEDVVRPGGIRSLANPLSRGDPDHYSRRFLGTADNGGVHTNSTIASHAYYLAVEGGTNLTSGVRVVGLGPENRGLIEQIFYRAFVFLLPEDATFSMARAATLQSARDLSDDDRVEQTIAAAWTAVGVE